VPASPRGAALWDGRLWISHTGGLASEISISSFTVTRTIDLDGDGTGPMPRQTIGAAVDSLGHAWMVSETGGPTGGGMASRIDVERAIVDAQVEVGRAPHVQGDLSGWQRVGEREPEGTARHVFTGCDGYATNWLAVHVHAELGVGGELAVSVRHAETVAGLAAEDFAPLGTLPGAASPLPLDLPDGGAIELEVTLRTRSHRSAPVLELLGVEWDCGGPG
jgi:hypothetical protein